MDEMPRPHGASSMSRSVGPQFRGRVSHHDAEGRVAEPRLDRDRGIFRRACAAEARARREEATFTVD